MREGSAPSLSALNSLCDEGMLFARARPTAVSVFERAVTSVSGVFDSLNEPAPAVSSILNLSSTIEARLEYRRQSYRHPCPDRIAGARVRLHQPKI